MRARILAGALALAVVLAVPAGASASGLTLVGSVSNSTNLTSTTSVAISGHYAYTTAYHAGQLTAVDISNPSAPVVAGSSASSSNLVGGSNVAISGTHALVVSKNRNGPCLPGPPPNSCGSGSNDDGNGNSLTILDLSNPAVPSIVGTIRSTTDLFGAYGVAVSPDGLHAYVAYQGLLQGQPASPDMSTGGFTVFDLNALGPPAIAANIDNGSLSGAQAHALEHATSVQLSSDGHYAYVTSFYGNGITIIDVSNASSPSIVSFLHDINNLAFPADLAVQGNDVYVANQTGGSSPQFAVVDVSVPSTPHVVGTINDAADLSGAYRIRVRGNYAYVSASSADAVAAIDISNPSHPQVAGVLNDPGHLHRTTGLDLDPTGRYVVASSPYLSTQTNTTYPPYPLQSGGPSASGTISVLDLATHNATAPAISAGSATIGQTISVVSNGTWNGTPSPTLSGYQWERCDQAGASCAPITGQTGPSYLVQRADVGSTLEALVTFTNALGPGSTASAPTSVVTGAPVNTTAPSINGTRAQGQTLTASPGSWAGYPPAAYAYQWSRCSPAASGCASIAGATGQSYLLGRADVGATMQVTVTATNPAGSASAASPTTRVVSGPPLATAPPGISGSPVQGNRLTGRTGTWTGYPAPTFSYEWKRCNATGGSCKAISGATATTYLVSGADIGSTLRFSVQAVNRSGTVVANSAATRRVTSNATVSITGIAKGKPKVSLRVSAAAGHRLTQLLIVLPATLRFPPTRSHRWLSAVSVKDGRGHRLKGVSLAVKRGVLVVKLKRPPAGVRITISSLALQVQNAFRTRVRHRGHRKVMATLGLTVSEDHGLRTHDQLTVAVS